jgi:hypothetical protein
MGVIARYLSTIDRLIPKTLGTRNNQVQMSPYTALAYYYAFVVVPTVLREHQRWGS